MSELPHAVADLCAALGEFRLARARREMAELRRALDAA